MSAKSIESIEAELASLSTQLRHTAPPLDVWSRPLSEVQRIKADGEARARSLRERISALRRMRARRERNKEPLACPSSSPSSASFCPPF